MAPSLGGLGGRPCNERAGYTSASGTKHAVRVGRRWGVNDANEADNVIVRADTHGGVVRWQTQTLRMRERGEILAPRVHRGDRGTRCAVVRGRFAYTVLGDGVNLASRLDGVNKKYQTQILLSEATAARVRDQVLCRPIDRVSVKGRTEATLIFEALCELAEASPARHDLARAYESALAE